MPPLRSRSLRIVTAISGPSSKRNPTTPSNEGSSANPGGSDGTSISRMSADMLVFASERVKTTPRSALTGASPCMTGRPRTALAVPSTTASARTSTPSVLTRLSTWEAKALKSKSAVPQPYALRSTCDGSASTPGRSATSRLSRV